MLGLREGSTESTRVVRALLSDLIERGMDADRARLWVIDGGKSLRKAIVECFGATAVGDGLNPRLFAGEEAVFAEHRVA